jgi:ankyrin repeat protein
MRFIEFIDFFNVFFVSLKILLANGVNPDSQDPEGFTPLMLACVKGNIEMVLQTQNKFSVYITFNKRNIQFSVLSRLSLCFSLCSYVNR